MSEKTLGEELSDMFYALQITTKIMEGITNEHDSGSRSQEDFEARWKGQSELLCRNLAKIKPLTEKFIYAGYSKFALDAVNIQQGQQGNCPKQEEAYTSGDSNRIS
jgi:hypothetical protein